MNSSFSTISFGMKSLFFLLSLINHCLFIDGFHIQSAHNLYSSHLFGGNQHTMMEPVDSNAAGVVSTGLYKIVSSADYNFERVKTDLSTSLTKSDDPVVIQLGEITSGWGNGAHPTTRLCLEFISEYVQQGDKVLDYGTGSGVLSILAAKRGASRCVAVDIDEETLRAAEQNAVLNGVGDILDVVHTKYVYVGEDRFPICDITVANILPVSVVCRIYIYFDNHHIAYTYFIYTISCTIYNKCTYVHKYMD